VNIVVRKGMMKPVSARNFWQIFITSTVLTSGFAVVQTVQRISSLDVSIWRSKWILLVALFALNILLGIFVLIRLSRADDPRWVEKIEALTDFARLSNPVKKSLGIFLILLGFSLFWIFRFFIFSRALPQVAPIFWVFLWAGLIQSFGLKLLSAHKWHIAFAFLVVAHGIIYQIYASLNVVSAYPFSIGYSEASRHYYASMFRAELLYRLDLPFPFLHPTRYMLLSLPFWVNGLPLWFHRLWQAILWFLLTGTSSILLARRLKLNGWAAFFVAAWAYVYFLQGAVYYHLHVCVILILAGVSSRNFWRSLIFVMLASFWAGMSRVNWFPVPAMLAIAIYILETSLKDKGWRYWAAPFAYGALGLIVAALGQIFYIQISGNADVKNFGSSFTSDLLWNRLLPNDIFSGVIIGVLFVSAPLIVSLAQMLRGKFPHIHPLRWLALLGLILLLLLGGLVVSVKIGGGGDLHNIDAYLVMLALIATTFFAGNVQSEDGRQLARGEISAWVIAAALLIPLTYAIPRVGSFYRYDSTAARKDIQTLQRYAETSSGEVLFVTERQLFTYGELKNIPMTPEYEQIELMEFAMSGNRAELEKFYADLSKNRFAYIIAEEQKFTLQKTGAFKEENNAWVKYVGAPILCAYKPIETLTTTNIQVFVPRPNSSKCKNPFLK
jgi:hypothetical protein